MGQFLLLLRNLILVSCIWVALVTAVGGDNATDKEALLEFKSKVTDDPLGVLSSWNESVHFCRWFGVTCQHQRVTGMDLSSSQISGTISPHIGNLSFLRELDLTLNNFVEEIPSELGRLHRLQYLSLTENSLSGKIPANISRCGELRQLYVSYNNLTGEIPSELGALSKLNVITLGSNSLLTGSIPSSFGNLSSLEALYIFYTSVNKQIPYSLGQLGKLEQLILEFNQLSGPIPRSIFNLSWLSYMYLEGNQLEGSLPANMGNTLLNLNRFIVAANRLEGSIPPSISNVSSLEKFDIGNNKFTGKIPSLGNLVNLSCLYFPENYLGSGESHGHGGLGFICSLINASKLHVVDLEGNSFGGEIPKCISNLSSTPIVTLGLNNNFLVGGVPSEIGELGSLTSLFLGYNKLTGRIPGEIAKLSNLVVLDMKKNKLSGEIPPSLGNLTSLDELYLSGNNLQGSIPSSLGRCTKLSILNISNNNLSGSIPPELVSLSSLSRGLLLSGNHLTGSLPTEVGNLKNNGVLDVSRNMLSGQIPTSLGGCTSLEYVDLSENSFSGSIPLSLEPLRGLAYLNLAQNNLSGAVPKFLGTFIFLQTLNLSYNNFEGPLPTEGVFKNSSAIFVAGNRGLCGGIPELGPPRCKPLHPNNSTLSQRLIFVIVASGMVAIILVFACFVIRLLSRKKAKKLELGFPGESIPSVSYHSLVKATNGFSSANLLGKGSFGSVYKGIINLDLDTIVAIKVLDPLCRRAFKSFAAECTTLRNIRHRNLLEIVTVCSGIDSQGGDFKALVYEYMPNGSLEMWLHPAALIGDGNTEVQLSKLGFFARLIIAIDVASALEYLHHHCQPPIAHCDLKPSNILLDAEMAAHVGDFGLARILQEATPIDASGNNNSSSICLRGTVGYAPPEYGVGGEVSIQGDVYSYGILLLEMFTGKRPTDEVFNESLTLRTFVNEALPNKMRSVLDPALVDDEECFTKAVLEIGLACSEFTPRERKSMDAVATELTGLKNKLVQLSGRVVNP